MDCGNRRDQWPGNGRTRSRTRRWFVAAALVLLPACGGPEPAPEDPHAHHEDRGAVTVNWSRVSDRDLDIASVFITARAGDPRAAIRKLEEVAADDSVLFRAGHEIAHGVGRFIAERTEVSASLLARCLGSFRAGCFHGMLEQYVADRGADVPDSLVARICLDSALDSVAPIVRSECAHGLGHGLLARHRHALDTGVGACGVLGREDLRVECTDGVFMEFVAANFRTRPQGDDAARGDNAPRFQLSRPDWPCSEVAPADRPSCWSYQPVAMLLITGHDVAAVAETCRTLEGAERRACFRGLGKHGGYYLGPRYAEVARGCAGSGDADLHECLAGLAEHGLDADWSGAGVERLCASLAEQDRDACRAAAAERAPRYRDPPLPG